MKHDSAEMLAIRALGWIASQHELLPAFLAATGASPADLRQAASQPAFLRSVLEFLLQEDARVTAFCDEAGLPYSEPMQAHLMLLGEAGRNWT
ncbi:DUF3572 domain-containing protein [Tabrizicola sp. J26]|uniref:DUF3572 domain-containing protein n=1 Tax=Alitabrizicola rongguiensis TaxID=2909234 RepID=UPI001F41B626|nr:DUF3572 domain-containing protein [Tabrizicola rongguiensis]MCF1708832.1 DUF3572 domain-containing protein [Tabrizicola rongguiensis]